MVEGRGEVEEDQRHSEDRVPGQAPGAALPPHGDEDGEADESEPGPQTMGDTVGDLLAERVDVRWGDSHGREVWTSRGAVRANPGS